MTALPFAIRNEEMLCAYLAILDDGNHTMTKTDKLIDTLEKCYHLYDEATEIINSFNWIDDNKSLDAKGYCDCCDAIVSKKDLSPMDGAEHWNCCTNCNLSTFSYN
jgi:hypothetical protein